MICFFCATPYHIMLALIIKNTTMCNFKTDIIIYNHFSSASQIYKKLLSAEIFTNVYFIDENSYGLLGKIKRASHVFWPSKVIKLIAKRKRYSEIIFFSLDFLNIAYIIKEYEKCNVKCEFSYGEDGIGTYVDKKVYIPSKFVDIILYITNRRHYLDRIRKLYLSEPSLLQCNFFSTLKKIETGAVNKELDYCKKVLWPEAGNLQLNTVIYLQQPFSGIVNSKVLDLERDICQICFNIFADRFLIKLHPRTKYYSNLSNQIYKDNIPFECLISNSMDENHIIISVASTAAFTPLLLYNRRPYLIFIYDLIPDYKLLYRKEFKDFLSRFEETLQYKERIFIPQSKEETVKILLGLSRKIH